MASSTRTTLPFPAFLLPSIPFRRRRQSSSSLSTDSTPATPPSSNTYLRGHASLLRCARCAADLALTSQIISKGFTGRHGRAYLVAPSTTASSISATSTSNTSSLPNTHTHAPTPRELVTGLHTVSDISCAFCSTVLGWKYVAAEDEGQRYKVGKFILERGRVRTGWCWEEDGERDGKRELPAELRGREEEIEGQVVEFDSQDEDECEDLFAGVWSPGLAVKRRKGKRFERGGGAGGGKGVLEERLSEEEGA